MLKNTRILVVDDNRDCRETIGEVLRGQGAQVCLAGSADEAMTAVEDFRPDLLLSDISMPGEDGYSLMGRVRGLGAARGGGDLPALAFSALSGPENVRCALAAGFQAHLAKPADIDHLIRAVRKLSHFPR